MSEPISGEGLLLLTDEQLQRGIEGMFFAYRGFTADPDRILEELNRDRDQNYGRAHHRALHLVARSPGTTVKNLLETLGDTKQSLNRVLRTLTAESILVLKVVGSALHELSPFFT